MIRIEPARLRQEPQSCRAEALLLRPDQRLGPPERRTIGPNADHRDPLRPVALHLPLQPPRPGEELLPLELGRGRRGPRHEIRDPVARVQQLPLLPRREQARGEPRAMQHGPEAIAGPREMMARRAGVETRIDAAEEHAQPGRDYIGHRLARCCQHLGAAGRFGLHPFLFPYSLDAQGMTRLARARQEGQREVAELLEAAERGFIQACRARAWIPQTKSSAPGATSRT